MAALRTIVVHIASPEDLSDHLTSNFYIFEVEVPPGTVVVKGYDTSEFTVEDFVARLHTFGIKAELRPLD